MPTDTSISAFKVLITLIGGATELHDNNGVGFPVQDTIMLQSPESCLVPTVNGGQNLTVVAAVSAISQLTKDVQIIFSDVPLLYLVDGQETELTNHISGP